MCRGDAADARPAERCFARAARGFVGGGCGSGVGADCLSYQPPMEWSAAASERSRSACPPQQQLEEQEEAQEEVEEQRQPDAVLQAIGAASARRGALFVGGVDLTALTRERRCAVRDALAKE